MPFLSFSDNFLQDADIIFQNSAKIYSYLVWGAVPLKASDSQSKVVSSNLIIPIPAVLSH